MVNENFYLELLQTHINKLSSTINNKDQYDTNVYNCILAGIVIQINSIVEQCVLNFHGPKFTKFVDLVYSSRQLLVHYSDYRTFSNIEDISRDIVEEFEKKYKSEKAFFEKLLKFDTRKVHNVVVEKNKHCRFDEFSQSYIFSDDNIELVVSKEKVTRIQNLKNRKDLAYIVNCDCDMNYFETTNNGEHLYKELNGHSELQSFFLRHFNVMDIDTTLPQTCIKDILENFYKSNSYNSVYVYEVNENNKNDKTLYLETDKILDKYFNEGIVFKQLLNKRRYGGGVIPENHNFDFHGIKNVSKEKLESTINTKDFFFIHKAISEFNSLRNKITENAYLSEEDKDKMIIAMMINWSDHTIKHFSESLISCSEDFKKLHLNLVTYRNFFSHNISQVKSSTRRRLLDEFFDVSSGYVMILNSLNINRIANIVEENEVDFVAIEKSPKSFVSRKYEQFIEVDPNTYIGDKLFYSTRGSDYEKIIGLVATSKHYPLRGAYFEKNGEEINPKTVKARDGKPRRIMVSKIDPSIGKETIMDVNLSQLLYIFAAYKGKVDNGDLTNLKRKKMIVFAPSEENNFTSHATDLETLISEYFQQRFLPYELVKQIKISKVYEENNGAHFVILDANSNKLIGEVVDVCKLDKYDVSIDEKGYFTINDTIHNFRKRGL